MLMKAHCVADGCHLPTAGNSKYCYEHRAESRERFKALCAASAGAKADREATFESAWQEAHRAGQEAGSAAECVPMVVVQRANPLDDRSRVVKQYEPVMDGVCGFASITVAGNTSFGKWLLKKKYARKNSYSGGVTFGVTWIDGRGYMSQSLTRNETKAYEIARVLIKMTGCDKIHAASRID